ncbi:MAG TPA: YetF domain-containing protein [Burkholderiales bacterium]|nr:YetF domain-containing protein [Burkholderiales bacterium]
MDVDWAELFRSSVPPLELIARGSAMYLFLFVLFRFVVRRRVGSIGMADILILVIVADAAQNGMSGEYRSVTDAFVLVGTLIGWNLLIDWLNFNVPALRKVLEPPPLLLIENGRVLWRNLRHENVTEGELKSKLREHGVGDPSQVAKSYMEPDGQITVLKKQK